jgi:serine protease Do
MQMRARELTLFTFRLFATVGVGALGGPHCALAVQTVDIASTVQRVMAGVVNIRTRDIVRDPDKNDAVASAGSPAARADRFFDLFLFPGVGGAVRDARSQGSGFFIRGKEYIVTNHHVVKDAQSIDVVVHGRRYPVKARVVGSDARTDIAVLKVERVDEATNLAFGSSERTRIGEGVFTIGNPFGYGHTVTSGILSARNRTIGQGPFDDFIQTDAAVNPGNSGGPLFNARGEVIGINTALLSDARGISFAIPSETARKVTDRIMGLRKARRTWLGIVSLDLKDDDLAVRDESFGVVVQNLAKGSPAHTAGLEAGDVILAVNEKSVRHANDILRVMDALPVGRKVELKVFRKGTPLRVQVTLGALPANSEVQGVEGLY